MQPGPAALTDALDSIRGQNFRQLLQPDVNDNHSIPSDSSILIEWPIRRSISATSTSLTAASRWSLKSRCHHSLSPPPQETTETCILKGTSSCADEPLWLIMNCEEQALTRRLRMHVEQLSGEIGERNVFSPTALRTVASYIEREWEQQGYAVTQIAYDVWGVRCLNLEITRSGGARQHEILLIGAHYDTVTGSPGANDNASGVSALFELSRLFASIDPALTVRFVAFVNEEPPFFMTRQQGSMVYAEAARRRGDDIRLMASIETIGWYSSEAGSQSYPPLFNLFYPNRADFIGIVSNFRSRAAMQRLAGAFRANSDFPLETAATFSFVSGVSWSDHRSFGARAIAPS